MEDATIFPALRPKRRADGNKGCGRSLEISRSRVQIASQMGAPSPPKRRGVARIAKLRGLTVAGTLLRVNRFWQGKRKEGGIKCRFRLSRCKKRKTVFTGPPLSCVRSLSRSKGCGRCCCFEAGLRHPVTARGGEKVGARHCQCSGVRNGEALPAAYPGRGIGHARRSSRSQSMLQVGRG